MNNSSEEKKRWTISERFQEDQEYWILPERLFDSGMIDINDFEEHNYNYFLDHVFSLDELLTGLLQLSPFANDALSVAEKMNEQDFRRFKSALAKERSCESKSVFPGKFRSLILPKSFIQATIMAERYEVPLGVALIQLAELNQQESPA